MQRFILLALFALTLIAGSLSGAAFAAPRASTGAYVVDDVHVHEEPDGSVWQLTVKGVSTETLTPEGNTIHTANMKSTAALADADGALVFSSTSKQHQLRLVTEPSSGDTDGEQTYFIVSDRFSSTITLADGTVCSYSYRLHMVDGVIKIYDANFPCGQ